MCVSDLTWDSLKICLASQKLFVRTLAFFSVVFIRIMVLCVILISCPVFNSVLNDDIFFPNSNNSFLCLGRNKHDG